MNAKIFYKYNTQLLVKCIGIILLLQPLNSCKPKLYLISEVEKKQYSIDNTFEDVNSASISLIAPYKVALDSMMQMRVAISSIALTKSLPESLLGNLITDIIKNYYEKIHSTIIDALILNQGGLRIELPEGNITRSMVFELMPFDNELVVITMNGSDLLKICDHIANKGGMPVSGIEMGIMNNKAVNVKINGLPLEEHNTYKIATSDYLYNGGDNFEFNAITHQPTQIKIRDLIMNAFITQDLEGKRLHSALNNRIYYAQ